jgi:hypothetical protein
MFVHVRISIASFTTCLQGRNHHVAAIRAKAEIYGSLYDQIGDMSCVNLIQHPTLLFRIPALPSTAGSRCRVACMHGGCELDCFHGEAEWFGNCWRLGGNLQVCSMQERDADSLMW